MAAKVEEATKSHEVLIGFCGPSSPESHIACVEASVAADGHRVPDGKIRERWPLAKLNVIQLMAHVAYVKIYDNNTEAAADGAVPDPLLALEMGGRVISPSPTGS